MLRRDLRVVLLDVVTGLVEDLQGRYTEELADMRKVVSQALV